MEEIFAFYIQKTGFQQVFSCAKNTSSFMKEVIIMTILGIAFIIVGVIIIIKDGKNDEE